MSKKIKPFRQTRGGWWPCEEQVLISMLQDHYPVKFIAEVLNRERMGVHAKIAVMQRQEEKRKGITIEDKFLNRSNISGALIEANFQIEKTYQGVA